MGSCRGLLVGFGGSAGCCGSCRVWFGGCGWWRWGQLGRFGMVEGAPSWAVGLAAWILVWGWCCRADRRR